MRRAVLAVLVSFGCRYDLDHAARAVDGGTTMLTCQVSMTSPACLDAVNHSDLTWIQANIFGKQCVFSGCHNGGNTDGGRMDLRDGKSYAALVGTKSDLEPTRKRVVAGSITQSYLTVMLGHITPAMADPPAGPIKASVGVMPQDNGNQLLCCQKLDAIDRWIAAGAPNN